MMVTIRILIMLINKIHDHNSQEQNVFYKKTNLHFEFK